MAQSAVKTGVKSSCKLALLLAMPLLSIPVHEYGHWIAARGYGLHPRVVFGLRNECQHWGTSGVNDVVVGLAGGLLVAVLCGIGIMLVKRGAWMDSWFRTSVVGALVITGVAHLVYGVFEGVGKQDVWYVLVVPLVLGIGSGLLVVVWKRGCSP
jgi:hypothetical protein